MAVRVWVVYLLLIGLLGWRKGQWDRWAIATGVHRLETLCPLSASFPLILLLFSGPMELGKHFREDYRGSGQKDGPRAPVHATSCPIGPVPALLAAMPEASHP